MSNGEGILYIVATPIGNLGDFTARAIEVLKSVDLIAAEDTRHSLPLLQQYGIRTQLISLHAYNEHDKGQFLLDKVEAGQSLALISDAGTPLISDPGYLLVQQAHARKLRVSPIPGVSALIAALSVCGLPTDRFVFEGFLPAKAVARRAVLTELKSEARTIIFYESSHRIMDSISDMVTILGGDREAVMARELTKRFETVRKMCLSAMLQWIKEDPLQQKGEFVILLRGAELADQSTQKLEAVLSILLAELPLKQATGLAARLLDCKRNEAYQMALKLQKITD